MSVVRGCDRCPEGLAEGYAEPLSGRDGPDLICGICGVADETYGSLTDQARASERAACEARIAELEKALATATRERDEFLAKKRHVSGLLSKAHERIAELEGEVAKMRVALLDWKDAWYHQRDVIGRVAWEVPRSHACPMDGAGRRAGVTRQIETDADYRERILLALG